MSTCAIMLLYAAFAKIVLTVHDTYFGYLHYIAAFSLSVVPYITKEIISELRSISWSEIDSVKVEKYLLVITQLLRAAWVTTEGQRGIVSRHTCKLSK